MVDFFMGRIFYYLVGSVCFCGVKGVTGENKNTVKVGDDCEMTSLL